jgi:hypothetical protein
MKLIRPRDVTSHYHVVGLVTNQEIHEFEFHNIHLFDKNDSKQINIT